MAKDGLLSTSEIAKRFRVHETTVTRWIRCGALDAETQPYKGRHCYRVRQATLDKMLASGKEATR